MWLQKWRIELISNQKSYRTRTISNFGRWFFFLCALESQNIYTYTNKWIGRAKLPVFTFIKYLALIILLRYDAHPIEMRRIHSTFNLRHTLIMTYYLFIVLIHLPHQLNWINFGCCISIDPQWIWLKYENNNCITAFHTHNNVSSWIFDRFILLHK